jgi:histone deacetylase 8
VGFHAVGSLLSGLNLPVLVLGGGGYSPVPTACSWAALLAGILRQTMPEDVPDHEHLERYGPSFSVRRPGRTSLLSDSNDAATVRAAIGSLLGELEVAVARRSGRERHAELKRARVL